MTAVPVQLGLAGSHYVSISLKGIDAGAGAPPLLTSTGTLSRFGGSGDRVKLALDSDSKHVYTGKMESVSSLAGAGLAASPTTIKCVLVWDAHAKAYTIHKLSSTMACIAESVPVPQSITGKRSREMLSPPQPVPSTSAAVNGTSANKRRRSSLSIDSSNQPTTTPTTTTTTTTTRMVNGRVAGKTLPASLLDSINDNDNDDGHGEGDGDQASSTSDSDLDLAALDERYRARPPRPPDRGTTTTMTAGNKDRDRGRVGVKTLPAEVLAMAQNDDDDDSDENDDESDSSGSASSDAGWS